MIERNNENLMGKDYYQKGVKLYQTCKYEEAVKCFTEAANTANNPYPGAYIYLRMIYTESRLKDDDQADVWSKKIVENTQCFQDEVRRGSAEGKFYAGYLYQNGLGVDQDYNKALEYYKLSAGHEKAVPQKDLSYVEARRKLTREFLELAEAAIMENASHSLELISQDTSLIKPAEASKVGFFAQSWKPPTKDEKITEFSKPKNPGV